MGQGARSSGGHRAWRRDDADQGAHGSGRRRKRRRRHCRRGRLRRRHPTNRPPRHRPRPGHFGDPGHPGGCRRQRLPAAVDRRYLDRSRRGGHAARRLDRAQGGKRHAGLGLHGRRSTDPGRRRRHQLRADRDAVRRALQRDDGGGRHRRRFGLGGPPSAPAGGRGPGGGRTRRHGRQRRVPANPSGGPGPGRLRRRRPADQAGAGGCDVAGAVGAGRAGDGPGQGRRTGVGERAAVRVVHRGAGLRAGSRHRRGRPARPGRAVPRPAARLSARVPQPHCGAGRRRRRGQGQRRLQRGSR
ncbi:hypothetical protein PICSAR240_03620 [Mycobacterium avium subsp. paratuberculosis]|nr:hypothetical protein PICSAR104_03373 [Mycobacterium avium subsp. paratuberculosis]CAG6917535.1 hypothetical protein PICSAR119_03524 [Mycobacterium avium subsp. paratuberculosis]CAG6919631.1 hypothetical protein PICSAR107_03576 [Mycobacterium avium subsp. paratuberculosis]CAG6920403.1 hypothetical protein PICSAR120_03640 [Mycobacterium avium subsp. paratuberculosis]CAG6921078.1 hypothetical protein PICSAR113_03725 [Mycobacterium avium subsp. paratuberculosis]